MHVRWEFDDLNDLVVALRGRIGRDGMLLHTDVPHPVGTVLELNISLAGDTPLLRGTAGVIRLLEPPADRPAGHLAVVEFLELDAESEAFVGRLVARFEADDVELFKLDRYVRRGRRGISMEDGTAPAPGTANVIPAPSSQQVREPSLQGSGDPEPHPTRSSRRTWILFALLAAAVAVLAATRFLHLFVTPTVPVVDHGTPPGVVVESPPDAVDMPPRAEEVASPIRVPSPQATASPEPEPVVPSATRLESIDWRQERAGTIVTLKADGPISPDAVSYGRMDGTAGPRMALYLAGIAGGDVAYRTLVGDACLKAVRVWYHDDVSPPRLHVVLDLAGPGVTASPPLVAGHRLSVTLAPPPDRTAPSRPPATPGPA